MKKCPLNSKRSARGAGFCLAAMRLGLLVLLGALMLLGPALSSQAMAAGSETKIRITSDEMEALDQQGSVVFKGNVVTKRGDVTIYSDRLEVYYETSKKSGAKKGPQDDQGVRKGRRLKKIVAKGHVKVIQDKRRAVANMALYDKKREVLILKGDAQVWEGNNSIKGDVIRFYLNEDRSVVEGGKNRVEAVVYSDGE